MSIVKRLYKIRDGKRSATNGRKLYPTLSKYIITLSYHRIIVKNGSNIYINR